MTKQVHCLGAFHGQSFFFWYFFYALPGDATQHLTHARHMLYYIEPPLQPRNSIFNKWFSFYPSYRSCFGENLW